eukprot:CAMPEP_0202445514 /NCGR_PEP_ID=MMETSP1360-20130828/4322_1 /ASSEMBLY_ACC=CAM_ASM_000848 /TAXON_ID=515479 /ORGANISM="Licmophora paradoxa, Strain CCMP2313" /LENGTH=290 /DNA_ID=CAMNT_0049061811 /DNA_START=6 /DNA_END=878 /DNA_ORIENTATION=+
MFPRLSSLVVVGLHIAVGCTAFTAPTVLTRSNHNNNININNINNNINRLHSTGSSSSTSLAAAYKKVFVAGGSKGVGKLVVQKLVQAGSEVVALVRSDDAAKELAGIKGVTPIQGDAFIYKDVEGAIDGCDAVVTTLGGATGDEGNRIDYEGNSHVIEAAGILGVSRVVLVTSIGCGTSKEAAPPQVFEVLKDVLAAKERAENVLIKYYTTTDWTIIRPGGLKTEPMTGKAILTEDAKAIGSIHREDVADLVVQALGSSNTKRKVLSAFDPSITAAVNSEGTEIEAFALA